jgi:hypothetical protein
MNNKYSKLPYLLAVIFGFISPFTFYFGPFLIAPVLFFYLQEAYSVFFGLMNPGVGDFGLLAQYLF